MRLFNKRSSHHKAKSAEKITVEIKSKKILCELNFEEYIGRTITVYVNAGGHAGKGFTGVLIGHTNTYIKLLVLPNMAPACSLGNTCVSNRDKHLFCMFCPFNVNLALGTVAEISIMSIVAFVHNVS